MTNPFEIEQKISKLKRAKRFRIIAILLHIAVGTFICFAYSWKLWIALLVFAWATNLEAKAARLEGGSDGN